MRAFCIASLSDAARKRMCVRDTRIDKVSHASKCVRHLAAVRFMKSVVITRLGGPGVLQLVDRDLPEPSGREVRVKVAATGVAFADVLMRYGLYPGAPPVPFVPGYDIVGVVDAVGADATGFITGDTVAALTMT